MKKIVGWLAQSASHCCDLAATFNCFKLDSKSVPEIKVPSKVLTALADIIASAEANVPIPQHILQVLEDVIDLRTDCAVWYDAQSISDSTDLAVRNQSHKHFIKVLEGIQTSLSKSINVQASNIASATARGKKSSKSKKNKNSKKIGLDGLANLFEILDFEEPVSAPLGRAPAPSLKAPTDWS